MPGGTKHGRIEGKLLKCKFSIQWNDKSFVPSSRNCKPLQFSWRVRNKVSRIAVFAERAKGKTTKYTRVSCAGLPLGFQLTPIPHVITCYYTMHKFHASCRTTETHPYRLGRSKEINTGPCVRNSYADAVGSIEFLAQH